MADPRVIRRLDAIIVLLLLVLAALFRSFLPGLLFYGFVAVLAVAAAALIWGLLQR